jgi:hypothetical protein
LCISAHEQRDFATSPPRRACIHRDHNPPSPDSLQCQTRSPDRHMTGTASDSGTAWHCFGDVSAGGGSGQRGACRRSHRSFNHVQPPVEFQKTRPRVGAIQ